MLILVISWQQKWVVLSFKKLFGCFYKKHVFFLMEKSQHPDLPHQHQSLCCDKDLEKSCLNTIKVKETSSHQRVKGQFQMPSYKHHPSHQCGPTWHKSLLGKQNCIEPFLVFPETLKQFAVQLSPLQTSSLLAICIK